MGIIKARLAIQEEDGSPKLRPVTLKVTNGTLTDNGDGSVSLLTGGGSGTVTSVSVVTANGVSGSVATATTTPAITLTLGDITPSAVQISGLTASEIVITDASKNLASAAVATYPSLTELTYVKGVSSAIQTQIDAKAATNQTMYIGTTAVAINRASAALTLAGISLTTPDIGVATATSVNKVTITAPATSAVLTIADGKTLTISNSLTLTATDGSTFAIGTGGTLGTAA